MKTEKVPQSVKDLIEEGIFFKNDKANVLAWIDAFESIGYNRTDHESGLYFESVTMYENIIPSWDNGDYFHTVIILYPDNKAVVDCSWGSGNDEGPTNWGMYVDEEETTWELAFFKAYELKNYYRNVIPENIISELELLDILVEHLYYDQYDSDVLIKIPNILDIWSIDTKSVIEVKITPKEIKLEMEIVESQLEWCNSLQKEGSIAEMLLVLKQIYDTIKN